ncbi:DUF192 domain-containing protein [Synechococcus sp. ATX 2A4]|nr:DUF192 domain-containing protein [Synechococcus sp. ATX 2A4]
MGLAGVVLQAGPAGAIGAGPARTAQGPPQFLPLEAEWCLEQPALAPRPPAGCIQLEVPRSARQMALGLMERPPLGPLRGMWFRFDPPTPVSFWMHRVRQPLDLIYLRQGRVIAIDAAVPPCSRLPCPSYGPAEPADGVVELQAHEAQRLGIVVGSPAPLRWLQGRGAGS